MRATLFLYLLLPLCGLAQASLDAPAGAAVTKGQTSPAAPSRSLSSASARTPVSADSLLSPSSTNPEGRTFKVSGLPPPPPPDGAYGGINTDLTPANSSAQSVPVPAPVGAGASSGIAGLPSIVAAGAPAGATTPSSTSSQAAVPTRFEPETANGPQGIAALHPGQPVKAFATMADAAKEGVDPLRKLSAVPKAAPISQKEDFAYYWAWAVEHWQLTGALVGALALAVLMGRALGRRS